MDKSYRRLEGLLLNIVVQNTITSFKPQMKHLV